VICKDHETAASAVRNLNNVDVGGRPLRIDLADSDPFLEGKTTVRGELIETHEFRDRDRDRGLTSRPQDPTSFLAALPPGVPVPVGSTSLDVISQTLALMNPSQLIEVLAQMKVCMLVTSAELNVDSPNCLRHLCSHTRNKPAHYLSHIHSLHTPYSKHYYLTKLLITQSFR
jgi:hypothetical protein